MNEKKNAAGYDNEAKRRSRDTVKCRYFTLVGGPIHTHVHTDTHTFFFFLLVGPLITNAQLVETRALFDAAPFRAPLTLRVCHFIFH